MEENAELGMSLHLQSLEALQTIQGQRMDGTRHVTVMDNGVAIVDLIGPIFPRATLMTMSAGMSVGQFTQDLVKAESNPNVRGIVIRVDSPGGDVRGIGDASKVVNYLARTSKKPIKVFVEGYMASAAYYIGSAVGPQNIISTESGLVGSIGVVLTAQAKGKDQIEIVSSQSPYKRADAATDEGKVILQQQVDDLAEIFVRDVAKYRRASQAKVLSDYGQGAVLVAPRALKQGLVDSIGTLSDVVEAMASGSTKRLRTKASDETSVESLLEFNDEETNTMALRDILSRFTMGGDSIVTPIVDGEDEQGQVATGAESDVAAEALESLEESESPIADGNIAVDPDASAQAIVPTYEELEERFSDAAELFASQMTFGNKVLPAHSAYAASELLNAKIDDTLHGGSIRFVDENGMLSEGTREAAVRARYAALPAHTMTEKAIVGIRAGSIAASVLADNNEEKKDGPISEERRKELLAQSSQGQAVLNAHN